AHDQDVDLEVKAALVVLGRGDLREARSVAQETRDVLGFARRCGLFEACQQPLTDVDAHRPVVVRHKKRGGAEGDADSAHFQVKHGRLPFSATEGLPSPQQTPEATQWLARSEAGGRPHAQPERLRTDPCSKTNRALPEFLTGPPT